MIKPMKCECCGGLIDRASMICQMCGMAYEFDEFMRPVKILEYTEKVQVIQGMVCLPTYLVADNPELASEINLKKMAENMALKLLPLIEFTTHMDPELKQFVTYGRLKVANPHDKQIRGNYREIIQ